MPTLIKNDGDIWQTACTAQKTLALMEKQLLVIRNQKFFWKYVTFCFLLLGAVAFVGRLFTKTLTKNTDEMGSAYLLITHANTPKKAWLSWDARGLTLLY